MNATPKMPPRRPELIVDHDAHYHPERLLRAVAEILLAALLIGVCIWALRS